MAQSSKKQNRKPWVMVETKSGAVGMPLDKLQEARGSSSPVTRSDEQKKRVVSSLMSKLWGENL